MNYHDPYQKNGTITIKVVCAIVFCLFSFFWLFWYQADVLSVGQHILSEGYTSYHRAVGALLITLVLQALQLFINYFAGLHRRTHTLTYFPSMLLLAILSSVYPSSNGLFTVSWLWVAPFALLIWGTLLWTARQILPLNPVKASTGFFSRIMWHNLLLLFLMMIAVNAVSNSNAVFHYRAHVETALLAGDDQEAMRVGQRSLETDAPLTLLRMYALSRNQLLGERLFEYPICGTGRDFRPTKSSKSGILMLSPDSVFSSLRTSPDCRLCTMLIDRKIDEFAVTLQRYYDLSGYLPKHYREALTLYTHQRHHPVADYHNAELDEDWKDFQQLEASYPDKNERKGVIADRYMGSYWYYYFYAK